MADTTRRRWNFDPSLYWFCTLVSISWKNEIRKWFLRLLLQLFFLLLSDGTVTVRTHNTPAMLPTVDWLWTTRHENATRRRRSSSPRRGRRRRRTEQVKGKTLHVICTLDSSYSSLINFNKISLQIYSAAQQLQSASDQCSRRNHPRRRSSRLSASRQKIK